MKRYFTVLLFTALMLLLPQVLLSASGAEKAASGWYIRGAVGAVQGKDAEFSDENCRSASPPALFGCGAGSDGRALGAYGDFGKYLSLEIAGGRYVLPWLRMEAALNYRPNLKYSGASNFLGVPGPQPATATAQSLSLTANLYIELAPLFGCSESRWHPYVGAGLGGSYNRMEEVIYRFPEAAIHHVSITPSGERFSPAFVISCGLGLALSENWMFDGSIRYEDLGKVGTDRGGMFMDHIHREIEIAETSAELRGFGLMLGMRYRLPSSF